MSFPPAEWRAPACVRGLRARSGGWGGGGARNQPRLDRAVERGQRSSTPTRVSRHRSRKRAIGERRVSERSFTFSNVWGNTESLWWRRFAARSNTDAALHDGASRPNTDNNNIKWLYGCYRRICTLSKQAIYLSTVFNSNFFWLCLLYWTDLQIITLYHRSALLYTTTRPLCWHHNVQRLPSALGSLYGWSRSLEDKGAFSL